VRLTFRLQDGELWACDDEGRSRRLDDVRAAELVAWWEGSPSVRPSDGRTAAVLADLGQARMARPHPTGRAVSAQVELDGHRVPLGRLTTVESTPLADLLERRRSSRAFGAATLPQVATLLMRSGRVRDWTTVEDSYQASHRPAPSAGARHPFDLHLVVGRRVEGLDPGAYVFDAVAGALVAQRRADVIPEALLSRLGDHLGAPTAPAAAIFLVGYLDRTLSRYPAGMSLVWRDAGALLQTLHLCATDLRLRSCIAGTCGLLRDEAQGPVVDMGCLALGGPPR
jgi:SagB-type dehydrogenase family enzyme